MRLEDIQVKNYINGPMTPIMTEGAEPCMRERVDKIYEMVLECEASMHSIDGKLFESRPINGANCGSLQNESLDNKLQVIYSTLVNLSDSLRFINARL